MNRFERYFIYAALCLASGVALNNVDEGDVGAGGGGIVGYLIAFCLQWGIFALLFFYCYVRRRVLSQNLRHLAGPLPLALFTVLSILWSVEITWTVKRSVILVLNTFLGYYLGTVFNPDELSLLYRRALEIMVLLSIAFIVLLPSYGISHGVHTGDWKGAIYDKNEAGEVMALAFITFGIAPPIRVSPIRRWGFAALSLLLLYKSNSSSAIIGTVAVMGAQAVWGFLMLRRKLLTGLVLAGYPIAISAVLLALGFSKALFALVGKDSSFTGRDKVWAGVLNGIARKPWLGYGLLAFWSPKAGNLILIQERTSFVPSHAHNGYLNLLLHVGIVGMVLFLIFLGRLIWITIKEGRRTNSSVERWFFSFLVLILVSNITESHLLELPMYWISMVAFFTTFSIQHANRAKFLLEPAVRSHGRNPVFAP